ncbi:MAG TPA: hypothetical protein VL091_03480 [Marinobacter sp.]|nr:hypothetical protein [Marinobacter sp.]
MNSPAMRKTPKTTNTFTRPAQNGFPPRSPCLEADLHIPTNCHTVITIKKPYNTKVIAPEILGSSSRDKSLEPNAVVIAMTTAVSKVPITQYEIPSE